MNIYRWISAAFCIAAVIVASCATPSSPTGGPSDEEGPRIVRSEPESGTTNFGEQSVILHFSEYVNRSSLSEALVVEPDIGITHELDWGRKSVEIIFEEAIPDSTTLIITVGTEFMDMNNNSMAQPQKVAFSTGPNINEGNIIGRVLNARTGEGTDGERILLYREPYDLSESASYVASTDTSGNFEFSYLPQSKFKAFWVNDRNRNKIWDQAQERAQPFQEEFVSLVEDTTDTLGTVYITPVDTTRPVLQGVGLFSSQRLRLRFSEDITLTDSVDIAVQDTASGEVMDAYPLYINPGERFVLFGHSQEELNPNSTFSTEIRGVVDNANNPVTEIDQFFTGSAQEDTTEQRIIGRNNLSGYYPEEPIVITYAKPIDEPEIQDSLKIVEGDSLHEEWSGANVRQNELVISPDGQWKDGLTYEFRIWDPQIEDYRRLEPEIWHSSQMGELEVSLEDSTLKNVHLEVSNEESEISRDTVFTGQVVISNLPPVNYTVRAYRDLNENGQWDFGQVEPFVAPEPYFVQQDVPIKQDMTAELTISFNN